MAEGRKKRRAREPRGATHGKWDRKAVPELEWSTPGDFKRYMERWQERFREFDQADMLGEWLAGMPWEIFFTGTFRELITSLDKTKAIFNRFRNRLSRMCYGRNYWKREGDGVFGLVAYEKQKRGAWHLHALLAGLHGLRYEHIHEAWRLALGKDAKRDDGFALVKPFERGAGLYVAKYTAKEAGLELTWDPFGPWWRTRKQQRIPVTG